jgi:hypothetical protein
MVRRPSDGPIAVQFLTEVGRCDDSGWLGRALRPVRAASPARAPRTAVVGVLQPEGRRVRVLAGDDYL